MKGNSLALLILLSFLTSCGKVIGEKNSAPRTPDQVGIIASCTSKSEAQAIAQEFGVQYRVINEKRKLIEFIGLTQSELETLLPKSKFRSNKIYNDVLISGDFKSKSVANYEFYGAHPPTYRNESSGRYFPHLEQIKALQNKFLGEGITIAIIDTGVYYNHPHLSPNILLNGLDKHGSNADNQDSDNNGFIDDYVGWDFYNGDAYPIDDNGHGTHVAGLAASTYMGIAPKAKILPVKVLSSDGRGDLGTIAAGIFYAIDRGADIINLSLGGTAGSQVSAELQTLINATRTAKSNNTLLVAAAGNGGNDGIGDCNDNLPVYPANIQEENLISVASVDAYNQITEYSNFGGATVHIAAPGGDVYTGGLYSVGIPSCFGPCSQDDIPYRSSMGTSMSTPIVAGLAAVIKSANKTTSPKKIRDIILKTGTTIPQLEGLLVSPSVINVQMALKELLL
ncbi:MAG: S8 family serine peptidase [Bacteriovoracaceae bacterium]|jgi:subtilisin family serine protease|nr:S8 family serine peptidase [Bacteriovoracaceae bacterium]